jgi:hypothetical protein
VVVERVRKSRTITITDEVWLEAQKVLGGQLSQFIEDHLKSLVNAVHAAEELKKIVD